MARLGRWRTTMPAPQQALGGGRRIGLLPGDERGVPARSHRQAASLQLAREPPRRSRGRGRDLLDAARPRARPGRVRPGDLVGGGEAAVEAARILAQLEVERALGVAQRPEAGARRQQLVAPALGSRRGSRGRWGRRATSGRWRRRSRSRAAPRRPARPPGPARRRAARAPRSGQRGGVDHLPADPGDVRAGDQAGVGADGAGQRRERRCPDAHSAPLARQRERRQHAGVLLVAREHLVALAAGRAPMTTAFTPSVVDPVSASSPSAHPSRPATRARSLSASASRASKNGAAAAALLGLRAQRCRGGLDRAGGNGPVGAGVQVGEPLEDRELGAQLVHAPGY